MVFGIGVSLVFLAIFLNWLGAFGNFQEKAENIGGWLASIGLGLMFGSILGFLTLVLP